MYNPCPPPPLCISPSKNAQTHMPRTYTLVRGLSYCISFNFDLKSIKCWVRICIWSCFFRCGHCKSLAPEYEKAAEVLKQSDPPVYLGAVDATEQTDLASRFDVSGYPTLKFFKKGTSVDYDGPRNKDGEYKRCWQKTIFFL